MGNSKSVHAPKAEASSNSFPSWTRAPDKQSQLTPASDISAPRSAISLENTLPDFKESLFCISDCAIAAAPLLGNLPPLSAHPDRWDLIFSSRRDGKSFTAMVAKITGRGPTLILIATKTGDLFGGFAASPWSTPAMRLREKKSQDAALARARRIASEKNLPPPPCSEDLPRERQFFGARGSFLFRLQTGGVNSPAAWPSTEHDGNFQYFEPDTFPEEYSGLGMGGKPGLWGLFIDRYLEAGSSGGAPTCRTFGSPPLGSEGTTFEIAAVQVWTTESSVTEHAKSSRGILSDFADNTDRKILEMTGKEFYSDRI